MKSTLFQRTEIEAEALWTDLERLAALSSAARKSLLEQFAVVYQGEPDPERDRLGLTIAAVARKADVAPRDVGTVTRVVQLIVESSVEYGDEPAWIISDTAEQLGNATESVAPATDFLEKLVAKIDPGWGAVRSRSKVASRGLPLFSELHASADLRGVEAERIGRDGVTYDSYSGRMKDLATVGILSLTTVNFGNKVVTHFQVTRDDLKKLSSRLEILDREMVQMDELAAQVRSDHLLKR